MAACAASPLPKATAPMPPSAGDALLEGRDRGIHDARVDITVFLQIEVGGGCLGILKDERRGLIDRQRAGAGVGVGALAGVDGSRLEAERMRRLRSLISPAIGGIGWRLRAMSNIRHRALQSLPIVPIYQDDAYAT